MTSIAAHQLADQVWTDSSPVVLDIRGQDTFEEWHIPGSTNIAVYEELRDDPDAAASKLQTLPADEEIITVCGMGIVSQTATDVLQDLGYDAKTLDDGMVGWSQLHLTATVPIDAPGTLIQVARPGTGCLSYVLIADGEAIVFDPSQYTDEYDAILEDYDADLIAVYETHTQADHISGASELADQHDVPSHLHPADAVAVDATPITDGDTFTVGDVPVTGIHTPGHSPGSMTYDIAGDALLTGDTLFHDSVGRVELGAAVGLDDADSDENANQLYDSLQRVTNHPDNPVVLPAHDPGSPNPPVTATLEEVNQRNTDLHRDRSTFIEEVTADQPDLPPNVRDIKRANLGLDAIDDADRTSIELGPNRCAAE